MDIYPNQICFVYKWTQLSTNKWYIGSHTSKIAHPNNGYICSSKIVKPMILENPDDWIRDILETGKAKAMVLLEHELLTCLNAAQSEYSYNRSNGAGTFSPAGTTVSEITKAAISLFQRNRIRKPVSEITRKKLSAALKGKPQINRNPVSERTKKNQSIAAKNRINKCQNLATCPHCFKVGGILAMKRYHFDNCKFYA